MSWSIKRVGFFQGPEDPNYLSVDLEFKGLVDELNKPVGLGTYTSASCAGHFYPEGHNPGYFSAQVNPVLTIAAIPELPDARKLLDIIDEQRRGHRGAKLGIPWKKLDYKPEVDLSKYAEETRTESGLYVVVLKLDLAPNWGNDEEMKVFGGLPIEGNERLYKKYKKQAERAHSFWRSLEEKVAGFNREHGFNEVRFDKPEFAPFH